MGGCVIPIPLTEQTSADGGEILEVSSDSEIPLGVLHPLSLTTSYIFKLDVQTNSSVLAGRLFLELNDTCCSLNESSNGSSFLQFGIVTQNDNSGSVGSYTLQFTQPVQPCPFVPPKTRAYVVPVVATQGFIDGPTGTSPVGLGTVDVSHYWTIYCP